MVKKVEKICCKSAADTRGRILDAALEEFAIRSLDGARTREIAKKAGVNHASINYHFGGKEGMYLEIARDAVKNFHESYSGVFAEIEAFLKGAKKSPKAAKELIKKLLILKMGSVADKNFSKFILIIKREEIYPTDAFYIFYEGVFKLFSDATAKLISIAMKGKVSKEEACLRSSCLFSMNAGFAFHRNAVSRNTKPKEFTKSDVKLYTGIISDYVDRLF